MRIPTGELLLRIGLAFSFLYPPVAAFFDPDSWLGYFPAFVPSSMIVLHTFGVIEIVIALWIVFGKRIWLPSVLAAGMLIAIVGFNLGQFDILFRDLTIAAMALSLAWMHRPPSHGASA